MGEEVIFLVRYLKEDECMEKVNNIPTVYDPQSVEGKIYDFWLQGNFFRAEINPAQQPFAIVIPPPNVTGALHMGHALDNTLQDILIRWRRMQEEYCALWLPGTDHAGIATQIKVEEHLRKDGISRYDLGRERFIERVWEWKHEFGGRIINQLKRLGASCDWSRERFTMDEGCSKAVREVFVRLYEKGLIYQGNYIINWCPNCQTALSDIEVEHEEQAGNLWYINYPVKHSDSFITIATTRPETMLGDVAVAVHPDDERYRDLIGKTLVLPLVNREIPIIADEYVDPAFGTGAVKVTPAHDPNDFLMGERHGLEQIIVMNPDGTMNAAAGKYAGLDRYACRKQIVEDLKDLNLLVKIDAHNHAVGHCQRCRTVIEPLFSKQWFVRMKPLAEPAIQAVKEGRIRFVPERFTKIYLNWVENVRDWCISRQIWWGHRIPVWYCQECGEVIVSKEDPTHCPKCTSSRLEQDADVLDTWFSSALWPFSTLGWPEKTADLEYFYPTSVLVTGYDIIYFWVARMIFMGLEFKQEVPFKTVYIHGLVRDALGRKMSKSLGNGIDPLQIIDEYGADTLRFTLVTGNTPGNDMRFYQERVEASRNFVNKIWNASRFVMMNLADYDADTVDPQQLTYTLADRWILSRYNFAVKEVTRFLAKYEFGEAARTLYDFIWSEFCDWYIELVKPRLYGKETAASKLAAQYVLSTVLRNTLQLLHPFMPFITEEIWQHLPHEGKTIVLAKWPQEDPALADPTAETQIGLAMEIIRSIRNIRSEMNVSPGRKIQAILQVADAATRASLDNVMPYIENLANLSEYTIGPVTEQKPENSAAVIANGVEVYLPLKGLIDVEKEIERLQKELAELDKELARVESKLANQGFISKAPAAVIEKERQKQVEYAEKKAKVQERIALLRG